MGIVSQIVNHFSQEKIAGKCQDPFYLKLQILCQELLFRLQEHFLKKTEK